MQKKTYMRCPLGKRSASKNVISGKIPKWMKQKLRIDIYSFTYLSLKLKRMAKTKWR